ncbi:hypothetical protein GCK72_003009 [Caenorhabditis remanei]|uniref:Sdz-33 F-box domain-containing protein n=1 Tax=Caenorhabditis remanei TaxID=31234 RepID=A0A6A5HXG8_CAERE|nr:hypothetical protein GCK72_003009 [Caenorhabditis remanei]KAF1771183.1 hypothetical protein GCK72_003009 [Caenorhabditis remanei]
MIEKDFYLLFVIYQRCFNARFQLVPVFNSWPQKINIRNSDWFTLKSLLACTCTTIRLEESRLGDKDLDESRNITSFEATILGMNLREVNGMVIQTDDGSKKATIELGQQYIEMSVTPIE